jgi:putative ABC transport system permease protein
MSHVLQDLRYSLRTLRKSPGFACVAILTLALGIGANTAIFSFVDGILLKPLPYPDPGRIVRVLEKPPGGQRNGISTLNFLDWQKENTVFEAMAAQTGGAVTLSGSGEPVLLRGARVSARFFEIFGIRAGLGRTFLPDEDQTEHVVVLSNILWVNQFGSDPGIIGKQILLDAQPNTVIGVLPAGSAFDRAFNQLWRPLAFEPSNMTRNFHWFGSFARLKPGVSLRDAQTQMDAVGARIAQAYPDSNKGWGVVVERYEDILIGPEIRTALYTLLSATGMVLLIGCANLANLALARAVSREREVTVRASLGAGRWRLIRQFLTDNVLLSAFGGALGIGLGYATMLWLKAQVPPNALPREFDIQLNIRVLLFGLAVSMLTGLLFGLAPAIHATSPDLVGSMKEGGRGATTGAARKRVRDVLVVAEVALAFLLLVGSGLLMRSFFRLLSVEQGFDSTNVLTMGLPIATSRFSDPGPLNHYLQEIQAAIEAVPGVKETAITSALPLQGGGYGMPMQVAGRPMVDGANREGGFFKMVGPSYFHALGIKVLKGRGLSERDTKGAPPVTVINDRLAKRYFKDQDPIGQRILIQEIVPGKTELGPEIAWEVVGVIANEKVSGMSDEQSAGVYVSNEQSPVFGVSLVVRAAMDPHKLQKVITSAVHGVNPNQALSDVRTLDEIKDEDLVADRLEALLMTVFASVALLLAAIGIYGVISYSVAQRTHELGVRAALGANARNLLGLVLVNGLVLTSIGLAIGIAGALALTRYLSSLLFGVSSRDPATMTSVGLMLGLVAAIACFLPALRASKCDPMVALRHE